MRILMMKFFALCLMVSPLMYADTEVVNNITWSYSVQNGEAAVIGEMYFVGWWDYNKPAISTDTRGDIVVPDKLGGYPVTGIGRSAFEGCKSLTSITLPSGIRNIDSTWLSDCESLRSINVSDANEMFSSLDGVLFNKGKTILKVCPIKKEGVYTIPDSVTSIDDSAFSGCSGLTSITIPDSVTSIGNSAFYNCDNLESIKIPPNVKVVGANVFSWCDKLVKIRVPSKAMYDVSVLRPSDKVALEYYISVFDDSEILLYYQIINDIVVITDASKNAEIPGRSLDINQIAGSYVGGINDYAFKNCSWLTSVTIGDSIGEIGKGVFSNCDKLASISVSANNSDYSDSEGVLFNKDKTVLLLFPAKKGDAYIIPDSVTNIVEGAFGGCRGLTSITIPNSVTGIGVDIFDGCENLVTIRVPYEAQYESLLLLSGNNAKISFYDPISNCAVTEWTIDETSGTATIVRVPTNAVGNIVLPKTICGYPVVAIADEAFKDCNLITSVMMPAGIKTIGKSVFVNCTSLMSVVLSDDLLTIGRGAFVNCSALAEVTIPGGVTSVSRGLFLDCTSLETITVPSTLSGYEAYFTDGNNASIVYYNYVKFLYETEGDGVVITGFDDNASERIFIPDAIDGKFVTAIADGAFENNDIAKEFIISDKVDKIGDRAFASCDNLTNVVFGAGVSNIGDEVFSACGNLSSVVFNNGLLSVGARVFASCNSLSVISIPATVQSVAYGAFDDCLNLVDIEVASGNLIYASDGGVLFSMNMKELIRCPMGKSGIYEVPDSVTKISKGAFDGCVKLSGIIMPDGLTEIGTDAFNGCVGFTDVIIPGSVTSIGAGAFRGCTGIASVKIPDGVSNVGNEVFSGCSNLKVIEVLQNRNYDAARLLVGNSAVTRNYIMWDYDVVDGKVVIKSLPSDVKGKVEVPERLDGANVVSIADYAFKNNDLITSLIIPACVTNIGRQAFGSCGSLEMVSGLGANTKIGRFAFRNCSNLREYNIAAECAGYQCNGVAIFDNSGRRIISVPSGVVGNYLIPDGVSEIGDSAFYMCRNLSFVAIPNSVTNIDDNAFLGCGGLTELSIPNGVIRIGDDAFYGLSALRSIVIPDSVTDIGRQAFSFCRGLEKITFGLGITNVRRDMIYGCTNIVSVDFSESVTSVEALAFENTKLWADAPDGIVVSDGWVLGVKGECPSNIILEEGIVGIADKAFKNCEQLSVITFPNSLVYIGKDVFSGCANLETLRVPEATLYNPDDILSGTSASVSRIITIECEYIFDPETGKAIITGPIGDVSGEIILPSVIDGYDVIAIDDYAFRGYEELISVVIPDGVEKIGWRAFENCTSLSKIEFPETLAFIDELAFAGCVSLVEITLPTSLQEVYDDVFADCSVLETIFVPNNAIYDLAILLDGNSAKIEYYYVVAPSAPTIIAATDGEYADKVVISWDAVADAETYTVYRGESDDVSLASVIASNVSGTLYEDATVAQGVPHYYWVKAVNSVGDSGFSSSDSGYKAFVAPSNVAATDGEYTDKVEISWEVAADAETYTVYRSESDDALSASVIASNVSGTSYDDTTAVAGAFYYYWVKAVNSVGESGFSDSDSGYKALAAPGNVAATDGTYMDKVVISWNNVSGATSYTIYRGMSDDALSASIIASNVSGTEYNDTTAVAGTTYYYWVKAVNSVGDSGFSSSDSGYKALGEVTEPTDGKRYMVIDLSGGASATSCPISYLSDVPEGGWTDEYKTTKLVLRRIPAGTFMMGSPEDELGRENHETQHQVTLTKDFYIGVFEVTQKQYELVMGSNPSEYTGNTRPVHCLSYDILRGTNEGGNWPYSSSVDSETFLGRLRSKTSLIYDLPTEAQWEYACRAGTTTSLNNGKNITSCNDTCANLSDLARYTGNVSAGAGGYSFYHTSVGSYLPNNWGLYDMHGNVCEWVLDKYEVFTSVVVTDPVGPVNSSYGVARGGCWENVPYFHRSAFRGYNYQSTAHQDYGFRLAMTCDVNESVAPTVPSNVAATDGEYTDKVVVSWNAIADAEIYTVYRSESDDAASASVMASNVSDTSYNDTSAVAGTTYYYWVKAVNSVGESGFSSSDSGYKLSDIAWEYTISNGEATITGIPDGTSGDIVVPSVLDGYPVMSIGEVAFNGCSGLTSIVIPEGVISIDEWAFAGCSSLTTITIPLSVTTIDESTFSGTGFWNNQSDGLVILDGWVLGVKGDCPSNVEIPTGIKALADGAFEWCYDLISITIPDGVINIGAWTFQMASNLKAVNLGRGITHIKDGVFYGCDSLTSITIPDSVTSIGGYAFGGCSSLTEIRIPTGAVYASQLESEYPGKVVYYEPGTEEPEEEMTESGIPYSLIEVEAAKNSAFLAIIEAKGDDYNAVVALPAANGINTIGQCLIAGISPTEADAKFEVSIEIVNGEPMITYTPDLNEGGTKQERVYTIEGCAELGDEWTEIKSDADKEGLRFFRVKVALP